MSIQPIFPVAVLVLAFAIMIGATVFIVSRNQLKRREKIFTVLRLTVIYVLAFVIGLRPSTIEKNYEFSTKNLDVVLVMDTTISMWAMDYDGKNPRMNGAAESAKLIVDQLAGSNFALVTFDDQGHVLSPYTQDMEYIKNLISTLSPPDSAYATGSDMSVPYKDLEALLLSSSKKENRRTIVFFISDGEITNGNELTSYAELAKYVDAGGVLGYGTEAGGKMKDGKYGYIYDYTTHQDALSVIDEANLQKIAEDLGVGYNNMNTSNVALPGILDLIKESSKTIVEQGSGAEILKDTYFVFAIPLAIMLLLELYFIIRKGRL